MSSPFQNLDFYAMPDTVRMSATSGIGFPEPIKLTIVFSGFKIGITASTLDGDPVHLKQPYWSTGDGYTDDLEGLDQTKVETTCVTTHLQVESIRLTEIPLTIIAHK